MGELKMSKINRIAKEFHELQRPFADKHILEKYWFLPEKMVKEALSRALTVEMKQAYEETFGKGTFKRDYPKMEESIKKWRLRLD